MDDLLTVLQQDYQRFPQDQTFSIYAEDVYFKDPLNHFRGLDRYQKMIAFLARTFRDIHLDLHKIKQKTEHIRSDWTLSMTCPLPWRPRLVISGYSELIVNQQGLIISHVDYWHHAPWQVFFQIFQRPRK